MARPLYTKHEGFDGKPEVTGPFDNIPQVRAFARRMRAPMKILILQAVGIITVEKEGAGAKIVKEEAY